MTTGTVTSLHRWPVKSMGGEQVAALNVDRRGAAGDRAHAVFDEFKGAPRRLTAREAPRMLAWHAGYGDLDPAPGELPAVLGADLGRRVELRADAALMPDLPDSLLVITRASHEAVRAAVGGDLDVRRFRTNLLVDLDAEPYAEEGWSGRTLRVGDVELELLHPCERCVIPTRDPDTQVKNPEVLRWLHREHQGLFGINARARTAGRIALGDPVSLL